MGLIWGLTLILYLAFCCELLHQNDGEGWLVYQNKYLCDQNILGLVVQQI